MPEPSDQDPSDQDLSAFIERWSSSGGRERANYQIFLSEFCELLDLPRIEPAKPDASENAYTFDRAITHVKADGETVSRYIDFYKAGAFVLETKQGVEKEQAGKGAAAGHGKRGSAGYDKTMSKAHAQAEGYIHDLPASEGRPPFLIVCDIGYVFELYAEFTRSGGRYQRFPDPKNHRIYLEDLRDLEIRELFRTIWTDPLSLDPAKRIAKVTRDIADRLAKLAKSLEGAGHHPELVAAFLQRCLFTMFAEDIGLLPDHGFEQLLAKVDENPASFPVLIGGLWKEMATGTKYSTLLMKEIAYFNGGLFEDTTAIPLDPEQLSLLRDAAAADWTEVDPAIFGTLLERALDPRERHKLGAHYTPRSYVERLIEPTVIEPLREQWESVKAAAVLLYDQEKPEKARAEVEAFHQHLCSVRILDPACGSGNFLYVTLEHMKQFEAEVLDFFEQVGGNKLLEMDENKVRPKQFLGIEINSRAAAIAQLVIWIGYFQWHHKTTGRADTNDRPLLGDMKKIENRDAVFAYDEKIPRRDEEGNIVQIWDGVTTKPHPVTGKEVPDESAKKVLYDYTNPRRPEWPEADYVVGNPPFVGNKRMRYVLGDGYVNALRTAWKKDKPNSWDFVMFWWQNAAELLKAGKIERFGFVTTNSITQTMNRKVVESFIRGKSPLRLSFAIPDHPWVDSTDGAAVRIAMTAADQSDSPGELHLVVEETDTDHGEHLVEVLQKSGLISSDLKVGVSPAAAIVLQSNDGLCFQGMNLVGEGFRVSREEIRSLGFDLETLPPCIRRYQKGRELLQGGDSGWVIDCFGLSSDELKEVNPAIFQHLWTHVKPERDHNKRKSRKERWWLFGEVVGKLRAAGRGLNKYIATVETSKFKPFVFLDGDVIPDHKLYAIASDDGWVLGCLSAAAHQIWAKAAGGTLEDRPTWTNTTTFKPFPFPDPDDATRERIRDLGERLDAHRKRQQELHPELTLTGIYNVLEKLRAGETLTEKERVIHDQGLVSVLQQTHDDLDEAVFHAYGWDDLWERRPAANQGNAGNVEVAPPDDMEGHAPACPPEALATTDPDAWENELLERLVALNHERAEEEARGHIRWLRPEFQKPDGDAAPDSEQTEMALPAAKKKAAKKVAKQKWPDRLPDQVAAVRSLIPETGTDPEALSTAFGRKSQKRKEQIAGVLEVLASLGKV